MSAGITVVFLLLNCFVAILADAYIEISGEKRNKRQADLRMSMLTHGLLKARQMVGGARAPTLNPNRLIYLLQDQELLGLEYVTRELLAERATATGLPEPELEDFITAFGMVADQALVDGINGVTKPEIPSAAKKSEKELPSAARSIRDPSSSDEDVDDESHLWSYSTYDSESMLKKSWAQIFFFFFRNLHKNDPCPARPPARPAPRHS
jgi:hypothetical protein